MDLLAIALIAILTVLGLLHLSWGLGQRWPGTDAVTLHARVVGTPGRAFLGLFGWTFIAACLLCGAAIVWLGQQPVTGMRQAFITYGGYLTLILVFGLRGVAPYATDVFRYAITTPFYTLNRRYYAPLCLLIAAGLVADFPPGLERFISR